MIDLGIIKTQLAAYDAEVKMRGVTPSHWTRWMRQTIDDLLAEIERLEAIITSGANQKDPRERVARSKR